MRTASKFMTVLVGAGAVFGAACSSSGSSGGHDGGGGSGGGSNPFAGKGITLPITATGFVQDNMAGGSGVVGAWYAYGDGVGKNADTTTTDQANSDCILKGMFQPTDCTQITTPTPGQPFAPDPVTGAMCTSGSAAKVLNMDYSDLWGGGIALDFNNPGGDAGPKGSFDLSAFTGVGFVITNNGSDTIPMGKMRTNFPFDSMHGTDSPYYKGDTLDNSMLTDGQVVTIHWSDVGGPAYLRSQMPPVTPPPFDQSKVQSIQWQVFTNVNTRTPYGFCINYLTLLQSPN